MESNVTHQTPTVVLFACVHNAGRSQMAAALFNAVADRTKAYAISAGTQPASTIHPEIIEIMKELNVDLSTAIPQKLTQEVATRANMLITMGCGESCPFIPGLKRQDWPVRDPKGLPLDEVRQIREELHARVQKLVEAAGWAKASK